MSTQASKSKPEEFDPFKKYKNTDGTLDERVYQALHNVLSDLGGNVFKLADLGNFLKPDGSVDGKCYNFLREYTPIACVDAVLIPASGKREVLLFYRNNTTVAPNQYWVVGGKVNLGENLEECAMRKAKTESNLDVKITQAHQLFTDSTIFDLKGKKIHTINTLYVAFTPPYDEIKDKIKADDGNEKFKLFTEIDSNWHPYIKRAVQEAWDLLERSGKIPPVKK